SWPWWRSARALLRARRRSSPTPGSGWRRTSTRGRSGSWPSCPRDPPARSSRPPYVTASRLSWPAGHTGAVPEISKDDEPGRQDLARDEGAESPDGQRDPPADSALILEGIRALHSRLDELE